MVRVVGHISPAASDLARSANYGQVRATQLRQLLARAKCPIMPELGLDMEEPERCLTMDELWSFQVPTGFRAQSSMPVLSAIRLPSEYWCNAITRAATQGMHQCGFDPIRVTRPGGLYIYFTSSPSAHCHFQLKIPNIHLPYNFEQNILDCFPLFLLQNGQASAKQPRLATRSKTPTNRHRITSCHCSTTSTSHGIRSMVGMGSSSLGLTLLPSPRPPI